MDKLQERAIAFKRLLDYEYKIVLGRRGEMTELVLSFEQSDFPHLIGLHKYTDVVNGNIAKDKLFDACVNGKLTYDMISKSAFFHKNANRFEYFHQLEAMLDSNEIVFKCNTKIMSSFPRSLPILN